MEKRKWTKIHKRIFKGKWIELVTDTKIETYISNSQGGREVFLNYTAQFGIIKIELGKTNILLKANDLKEIIGAMK